MDGIYQMLARPGMLLTPQSAHPKDVGPQQSSSQRNDQKSSYHCAYGHNQLLPRRGEADAGDLAGSHDLGKSRAFGASSRQI